tara:strand:- start:165 stop:320 length:156 start_codon:yes stop_codon:yes gene_type:complete
MMEQEIMVISLLGFSTMISMLIYNSKKNESILRDLCNRISKLEGILQEHLK